MIWFTSDWHFGHDREFIWKPRGFSSIEEHDNNIIFKYNGLVSEEDDVYVLGDLMLGNNDHGLECLKQLNGKFHIIRGNHDTDSRIALYSQLPQVVEICDAKYLRYDKFHFFLCHYPCITSNYDDSQKPLKQRILNLCGHVHTTNQYAEMEKGYLSYHVEIDAHGGFPISLDEIINRIILYNSL